MVAAVRYEDRDVILKKKAETAFRALSIPLFHAAGPFAGESVAILSNVVDIASVHASWPAFGSHTVRILDRLCITFFPFVRAWP